MEKSDILHSESRDPDAVLRLKKDYQTYMIFCENCGHLERKGTL